MKVNVRLTQSLVLILYMMICAEEFLIFKNLNYKRKKLHSYQDKENNWIAVFINWFLDKTNFNWHLKANKNSLVNLPILLDKK